MKKILASLFLFFGMTIISTTFAADIGNVALRFCNNSGGTLEKTLSLTTSGQEEKEICMTLINGGDEDVNINISFVDGTITNDADQKKACKNEGEIENFGQYMSVENNVIPVKAKGSTTITGTLKLPEEVAGEIHGCVTYFIANTKKQEDMFNIMVRRANFIDVFAKGVVTIGLEFVDVKSQTKSLSKNPKILSYYDKKDKKLHIQSILKNKGTAEQGVTIKGEIKNRLGYQKVFLNEKRTLFAKQESNINTVIDNLPFYKGPYIISLHVEHTANLQEGLQVDTNDKGGNLTETTNILVITPETYISLVGVLALIAVIILIIKRRKHSSKKRHLPKKSHKTKTIHKAKTATRKAPTKKVKTTTKKTTQKKK